MAQAESLGSLFRNSLFPAEGGGFLRLHSTYRHDLKIYSSDEGRVQMTAAAFARGFLDLEGFLTPILASLVSKDKARHMRPAATHHIVCVCEGLRPRVLIDAATLRVDPGTPPHAPLGATECNPCYLAITSGRHRHA